MPCVTLSYRQAHELLQAKGNNRVPVHACGILRFFDQSWLEILRVDCHFTRSNLVIAGAVITEFAHAQAPFGAGPDWGAKGPASHRPGRIKITQPGFRIEHRTGLVIGEVGEAPF